MAQFARPSSDISYSAWTGSYTAIDESSYSDADYITGADNANGWAIVGLSSVSDPGDHSGHVVRFRAWQENKPNSRSLIAKLYQGTTLIAQSSLIGLNYLVTAYSFTLTTEQAESITDYTDLRVNFTSFGTVTGLSGERAKVYVSWAELEVPTVAGPTYTLDLAAGSYALTGKAVSFIRQYVLNAAKGVYTISGKDVVLDKATYYLAVEAGSYALTGKAVSFSRDYAIQAETGSYALTGNAVGFTLGLLPYTGSKLFSSFNGVTLSDRYRTFSESETVGLLDKSCYSDQVRNYAADLIENTIGIEVLSETGGAFWDAVQADSQGELIWTSDSRTMYSVDAIVKSRKRTIIIDDIVKMSVVFAYTDDPTIVPPPEPPEPEPGLGPESMITLGIGSDAEITWLITTGLHAEVT